MHDQPARELRPGGAPDRVATVLQRYQGVAVRREHIAHEAGVQTCKLNGILTSIESHLLVAEDDDGYLIYMGERESETQTERMVREERERRESQMEEMV